MSTVSQFLTQTSIIQPYSSAPCDDPNITETVLCQSGDWAYSNKVCLAGQGPLQYNCSKIDPDLCPDIGTQPYTSIFTSPPTVKCTYDIATFQKSTDVNTWISNWGKDANFNKTIMPFFCSNLSTSCPIDPLTGQKMSKCTKFVSINNDGTLCKSWSKDNVNAYNTTITKVCLNNNTADCLCENRQQDALYTDIKMRLTEDVADNCWWKPCTLPNTYVINSYDNVETTCPADICTKIKEIIKYNNLDKKYSSSELNIKINCSIENPINNRVTTSTIVWIIIIVIIILLIICFLIFLWK